MKKTLPLLAFVAMSATSPHTQALTSLPSTLQTYQSWIGATLTYSPLWLENTEGVNEVDDNALDIFGGNPRIKSQASIHLEEIALTMIVEMNAGYHGDELKKTIIEKALVSANQSIDADLITDQGNYDEQHKKISAKIQKSHRVSFPNIEVLFKKKVFGKKLKFDNDKYSQKLKTTWLKVLTSYKKNFLELIKTTAELRNKDPMSQAQKTAREKAVKAIVEDYKAYLEGLWDANSGVYGDQKK